MQRFRDWNKARKEANKARKEANEVKRQVEKLDDESYAIKQEMDRKRSIMNKQMDKLDKRDPYGNFTVGPDSDDDISPDMGDVERVKLYRKNEKEKAAANRKAKIRAAKFVKTLKEASKEENDKKKKETPDSEEQKERLEKEQKERLEKKKADMQADVKNTVEEMKKTDVGNILLTDNQLRQMKAKRRALANEAFKLEENPVIQAEKDKEFKKKLDEQWRMLNSGRSGNRDHSFGSFLRHGLTGGKRRKSRRKKRRKPRRKTKRRRKPRRKTKRRRKSKKSKRRRR